MASSTRFPSKPSVSSTFSGASLRPRPISRNSLSGMAPRMPPSASASRSSTATWATKVLVEATQISGPAFVIKTASASRVMSDPLVLVIASTLAPKLRAV
jgi:hypothetical protein